MTLLRPHFADDVLAAGPWCWPRDGARLERLLERHVVVPVPRIGSTAVLTVQDGTVVLWRVEPARREGRGATLGPVMRQSWRDAGIAVPRGLPVLWNSMHAAVARMPDISYLASIASAEGVTDLRFLIDGPSFGLAFCLSLASTVLDCPLPGDLVASATVDAAGIVGPVGGLDRKIAGLRRLAPQVTRILVATSQRDEAQACAGTHLAVVPVAHAAEAIDVAFSERLSTLIVAAGEQAQRREELTASFFRLALIGSDALVDWAPVMRGARLALDRWIELSADARYRLEFAHAVAARHNANAGTVGMPPEPWLRSLPRMVRVQVVAHLVQQCGDAGTPDPNVIEPFAERLLDHDIEESSAAELRLRGALARLQSVTGRAAQALVMQERLAHAFAAIYEDADIAYPLSEWARLAGVLRDTGALDRAREFHEHLLGAGGYRRLGGRFVELALARGRLLVDANDAEARQMARALATDEALPDHVRWCASRWVGAGGRHVLEDAAVCGKPVASRNLVLLQLDDALRAGNTAAAEACVDTLESYDPGPVGHLRRSGASPADMARLYPY